MKKFRFLLMFLLWTLTLHAQNNAPLKLICQGTKEHSAYIKHQEEALQLRDEVEFLIKDGNYPVVIEEKRNVLWVYLNDPYGAKDYPVSNFESDYFETVDLFPLKLTNQLKSCLKKGNKFLLETLGITYIINDGEVISKIDYNKFDRFVFWIYKKTSKKLTVSQPVFFIFIKNNLFNVI